MLGHRASVHVTLSHAFLRLQAHWLPCRFTTWMWFCRLSGFLFLGEWWACLAFHFLVGSWKPTFLNIDHIMSFHWLKPSSVFLTRNNLTYYKGNHQCGLDSTVAGASSLWRPLSLRLQGQTRCSLHLASFISDSSRLVSPYSGLCLKVSWVDRLLWPPWVRSLPLLLCTGSLTRLFHTHLPQSDVYCPPPGCTLPENRTWVSLILVSRTALARYGIAKELLNEWIQEPDLIISSLF